MKQSPRCYEHKDRVELPRLCHVCQRIAVEHDIAERAIKAVFTGGYVVSVNNGEDFESKRYAYDATTGMQPSVDLVLMEMFATDDEYLYLWPSTSPQDKCFGWIRFVYGNDGYDVISDYTTNLEDLLMPVNAYADTLAL